MAPVARPLRIGLTGGIGSGKTTVARCLVELGAMLSDADAIARALTSPGGAAMPSVRESFGDAFVSPDGALDRDAMRSAAFGDPSVRRRLEAILHPLIAAEAERIAAGARRCVVFDIPLLAESTYWRGRLERIVVVDCSTATQVDRVSARPGWTRALAERVVQAQAPRAMRRSIADAVIHNEGISLSTLEAHVHALWGLWLPAPQRPVEQ
ncbi:MAG TPA: dephospho-CoA kinase [Burkholderiaceae bacterium]|nr:dephospho-CoA kinase [Burkholderiaceae bacterium]